MKSSLDHYLGTFFRAPIAVDRYHFGSGCEAADSDSQSLALLDLCLPYDASICSAVAFPPLGNSDHVIVSVSIDFPSNSKRMSCFIAWLMTILLLIGMVFMII